MDLFVLYQMNKVLAVIHVLTLQARSQLAMTAAWDSRPVGICLEMPP